MATYVNDLRLKEIATGDESGTWGTSTNTNLELIAEAFSFGTEAITTNADTHTTTIADGSTDPGRSIYLKYTGTLDSACTITIGPNTVSKLWFIENGTSGSQNIIISQGSGANVTIPAGDVKAVYSDGAGSGAAIVDAFTDLNLAGTTTVDALNVSGALTGSSTIQGTTITATTAFVPDASDGAALGTSSLEFSDLFLADAAVINLGDDQDTTLTHVADTGILLNSTRQLQFGDSGTYIHQSADGVLDLVSDTELELNATTIDINGNADISGTLGVTGAVTADAGVSIDNITIDGTEIDLSSGDLTIDVAGDIILDADGADIIFKDGGTQFGKISKGGGSDLVIDASIADKDIFFTGTDGSSLISALTLDMSDAGTATFNSNVNVGGIGHVSLSGAASEVSVGVSGDTDNSGGGVSFAHNTSTLNSYVLGQKQSMTVGSAISTPLIFVTNNTERMRIDSSGRVSIGTTTTDRELKVQKAGDSAVIAIVSGTSNLAGIVMGDTDDDDIGHILYNNSSNSMSFRTNTSDRMKIPSTGHLVLEEGNGIHADSGRTGDVQITGSFTNVLNFNSIGGSTAGTGFYLVTAVRTGASVGTHIVLLVGVSDSSTAIIYATLASATMAAEFSNDTLRLRETGGSTINVHVTAVPIGITGND